MLRDFVIEHFYRLLSGDEGDTDSHGQFGFHIPFEDLYMTIVYLACIYIAGQLASRVLMMPSLVGEMYVIYMIFSFFLFVATCYCHV
ncbi:MAG: hypothetical protein ACI8RD_013219 [Bacillariaceae sp.]|jgi:hypothetical protein